MTPQAALRQLESICREYGDDVAAQKLALLSQLERARFSRSGDILRFHEAACFLRAHPDDSAVLRRVVAVLDRFERRSDVRRLARDLADSGIAGTPIHFPFYWVTAHWLAKRWPERLTVDWDALGEREAECLRELLPLLVPYAEAPDFDLPLSLEQWIDRLKGRDTSDAIFLLRRLKAQRMEANVKERLWNELRLPLRLDAGVGGPSRTHAFHDKSAIHYRERPLSRERPKLRDAARKGPVSVREASRREANRLIDLARESMLVRNRDLDAIMYASSDDVRVIDAGDGLSLACLGLVPEQRALIETLYVFLLLQNGVPVGYYQSALLFDSAELNYNVFPSFRGGETALIYARALGVVHHLFGCDAFSVHPYQLGQDNPEALASGAFWFYQKLGFAPEDPRVVRILLREKNLLAKNPKHRSGPEVLGDLASGYLFHYLAGRREDVAGKLELSRISLAVTDYVADRFGSDRERALSVSSHECGRALGVDVRALSRGERIGWERWSPLALALGADRWAAADRRALAAVIRAKGAPREQPFARLLSRHRRLRGALTLLMTA